MQAMLLCTQVGFILAFNSIALGTAKTLLHSELPKLYCTQNPKTQLHSELPKLHRVLAVLSAIGFRVARNELFPYEQFNKGYHIASVM